MDNAIDETKAECEGVKAIVGYVSSHDILTLLAVLILNTRITQ